PRRPVAGRRRRIRRSLDVLAVLPTPQAGPCRLLLAPDVSRCSTTVGRMDDSNLEDEAAALVAPASSALLAVTYAVAALAVSVVAADGWPLLITLAFFVGLVVWTKHGAVLLPSNIDVSPSFMVVMAA